VTYEYKHPTELLRAELASRTSRNPRYSSAAFARDLGLSKAYLSLLLSGRRPFTRALGLKLAARLRLARPEAEYLALLCEQASAGTPELERQHAARLASFKRANQVTVLSLESFRMISEWRSSAVLEALTIAGTPAEISRVLKVDPAEVRETLARLGRLKLVEKRKGRYFRRDEGHLSTPHDLQSQALRAFHRQILEKAAAALESQPPAERQISGVTVALDPERLPEAKERIRVFMRELSQELGASGKPTQVYQLETLFFRLEGDEPCTN
jgi:uncharacterized protein (TIGR02147 family)